MNGALAFGFGALVASLAAALVRLRATGRRRAHLAMPLHELRGALAAIQLGLFGLERRAHVTAPAERADALRTQVERAHRAVEDLEAIERRQAAPRAVELVDVGELTRRRATAWARIAAARRRAVELRWPLGRVLVRADAGRLCQALDNLIVNALDHGQGLVRVQGTRGDGTVRIAISDQGTGLARPISELRGTPWDARHGHGIAVAARAAELHGGRLTARRGPLGSRVEIELPVAEAGGAQPDARTRSSLASAALATGANGAAPR